VLNDAANIGVSLGVPAASLRCSPLAPLCLCSVAETIQLALCDWQDLVGFSRPRESRRHLDSVEVSSAERPSCFASAECWSLSNWRHEGQPSASAGLQTPRGPRAPTVRWVPTSGWTQTTSDFAIPHCRGGSTGRRRDWSDTSACQARATCARVIRAAAVDFGQQMAPRRSS
jgi:hypothetical protein